LGPWMEWLLDFEMDLLQCPLDPKTSEDPYCQDLIPEFQDSFVWQRKSYMFGLQRTNADYKAVQVIKADGTKLPAFYEWLKYCNQPEQGATPGEFHYHEVDNSKRCFEKKSWKCLNLGIFCPVAGSSRDVTEAGGEAEVGILGKSGKFTASLKSDASNKVTVEMDALRQIDANGNAVGNTSLSLTTFAAQEFTIANPVDVKMGVDSSVSAKKISFTSWVGSAGEFLVETYAVTSAGDVGPDGEPWKVVPGDVKFNIGLTKWTFAEGAEFVELDIKMKGKNAAAIAVPGKANTLDLGGGVKLQLTSKITVDGKQVEMPAGYPKLRTVGGGQVFTFRFPKFLDYLLYDPLLGMGQSAQGIVVSQAAGCTGSLYSLLFAAFLVKVTQTM